MKNWIITFCFVLAVAAATEAALVDDIKQANVKFMNAFNSKALKQLSELYTTDCKIMPTGTDVVFGRDGVIKVFQGVIEAGARSVVLDVDEVGPLANGTAAVDGTMIYERSHYTFYKEKNEVFDAGKYVVIWRKMGQEWQLYIDIFNTDLSV